MNPEIKARWVAALRSGEYEQGKNFLNRDGKFCCLGVLSEIAVQDGVIDPPEEVGLASGDLLEGLAYDGCRGHLSQEVSKWAGFPSEYDNWNQEEIYDSIPRVLVDGEPCPLSYLNDHGKNFSELADLIEEYL